MVLVYKYRAPQQFCIFTRAEMFNPLDNLLFSELKQPKYLQNIGCAHSQISLKISKVKMLPQA